MDFLDPHIRRSRRRRLMVSYGFFAFFLVATTIILALIANGYWFNPKTRTFILNGLLFVDSQPSGTNIKLNGTLYDQTPGRLVLPSGHYQLTLSKSGFRSWQRSFVLNQQSVLRLTYPLLIPNTLPTPTVDRLASSSPILSQSPDLHWLLTGGTINSKNTASFELFNLGSPSNLPTKLNLPSGILSHFSGTNTIAVSQWSSDNSHLLFKHQTGGQSEFILFNRGRPADAVNLNKLLKTSPSDVRFAGSASQLWTYSAATQSLSLIDISSQPKTLLKLTKVQSFQTLGAGRVLYTTKSKLADKTDVRLYDNGQNLLLTQLSSLSSPLLSASQFQGLNFYVVASTEGSTASLFFDPTSNTTQDKTGGLKPTATWPINHPQQIITSPGSRFATIQSARQAETYDAGSKLAYNFNLPAHATSLSWLDGFRLGDSQNGQAIVLDFDGANRQPLASTQLARGGWLSTDDHWFWTLNKGASGQSLNAYNLQPKPTLNTVQ